MTRPQNDVQTPEAKAAYDARWQRIMDCVNLKQPDRMPTALFCTFWLAKLGGISHRQLMYDYDKAKQLGERALVELQPDVHSPLLLNVAADPVLEALDYKQLIWPGHGVGDNQPYQYLDRRAVSHRRDLECLCGERSSGAAPRRHAPAAIRPFRGDYRGGAAGRPCHRLSERPYCS